MFTCIGFAISSYFTNKSADMVGQGDQWVLVFWFGIALSVLVLFGGSLFWVVVVNHCSGWMLL